MESIEPRDRDRTNVASIIIRFYVLVAWLDGLVEILVSVEFTGSPQSFGAYIISQATGFLRYAAKL